jgi:hypothetical protein
VTTAAQISAAYSRCPRALADEIVRVAGRLGVDAGWLANVINLESGFDPAIENRLCAGQYGPRSGRCATGLIQFIGSSAAASLGMRKAGSQYTDAQKAEALGRIRAMTAVEQMAVVERYLSAFRPFPTAQSFYLSIFLPRARNLPASAPLTAAEQKNNPGIRVAGDYLTMIGRGARLPVGGGPAPTAGPAPVRTVVASGDLEEPRILPRPAGEA